MTDRSFKADLKVLVTAYLPALENLPPVQQLVLAQCAIYIEMDEALLQKEEGHDDIMDSLKRTNGNDLNQS